MQALLASLVFSMSVKDQSFRAAMATNRQEVRRTRQDFDQQGAGMVAAMQNAARRVDEAAIAMVDRLKQLGDEVQRAGLVLTVGLSVPLAMMGKASKDTASDFETAMNLVHSAMVNASPGELLKLRDAALTLGPAFGKSAIEAAGAIEALAKSGMDAASILGGGLESALKLSVVGQADLTAAAEATTDIVAQFHMSASQLPTVVDKVTGALDASKMSFDDYRLAIGQMGGVAGGLGYTFDDMNTGLAATASYFSAGSDAGTSFKTFLTMLNPSSEQAAKVMEKLGIKTAKTRGEFFQANGQAKSLGEIAEVLRQRLGKLSDASMQDALTTMFGTDAMRTAIALMREGSAGIADMQKQIESVTAQQKLDVLLDGEAAATQRLASSWEKLKIAFGEAGILQAFTLMKDAAAGTLAVIGSAPPWFFKLGVAVGLAAAALGPLTLAAVSLAKIALPLLALRLGPVALGMAAIINPVGVLISLLGRLALTAGAATVVGRLGTALMGVAGPIGLAVTGLSLLIPLLMRLSQASVATQQAQEALNADQAKGRDIVMQLATATGKAKEEALAHAKALRTQQVQALATARANVLAARTVYMQQRAAEQSGATSTPVGRVLQLINGRDRTGAAKDLVAANDILSQRMADLDSLDKAIAGAGAAEVPKVDMSFDDPKREREKKGRDAERDEAAYQDELGRSRVELLRAQADLTESARTRYAAEIASLNEDRASYARQLEIDKGLTDAKRATLLAARDQTIEIQRQVAAQALERALQQESYDLARAENEAAQDALRLRFDTADSLAGRRDIALRLLDLQRKQEEADIELILATKATASAEWSNARERKDQLDGIYADRRAAVERDNEGPGASYMRTLTRSSAAIREDIEAARVDALRGFNQDLTDAIMGTQKLGDAFANMGKRIVGTLLDIAIQQNVIKPMAERLFGGGSGGSAGGLFGLLGGIFGGSRPNAAVTAAFGTGAAGTVPLVAGDGANGLDAIWKQIGGAFGGFRAKGGGISPSDWYVVGEQGPELFAPGVSGTIIPNGGRGAGPRQQPAIVQLAVEEGALFRPVVRQEAGTVAVQTTRTKARADARAQSRRLR
ncbi:phage tail tape measure protein [uncultured Sphingomonas sp.]|uniref:phage tail tape measure protein n=1 Tax=uncultured Sphingomonas sp. TaxID=158754 RepID=UPI002609BA17|nr:phage tail tape measure protein [uncultured Sphingomonas sp.]